MLVTLDVPSLAFTGTLSPTRKLSDSSTSASPAIVTVTTWLVCPAANATVPDSAPVKSAAVVPTCVTPHATCDVPTALLRLTVYVYTVVVPAAPSTRLTSAVAMLTTGQSSLRTVAAAVAVPSVACTGDDSTTENASSSSISVSALTATVTTWLV